MHHRQTNRERASVCQSWRCPDLVTRYNHGRPRSYHQVDRAEIQMEYRLR